MSIVEHWFPVLKHVSQPQLLLRHCRIRKELSCEGLGIGDYCTFTIFHFSTFLQKQKRCMKMHCQNNDYEKCRERYFWIPTSKGKVIYSTTVFWFVLFWFSKGHQRQKRKGLILLLPPIRIWIFFPNLWVVIKEKNKKIFFRLWFCKLYQTGAPLCYFLPSVPAENFFNHWIYWFTEPITLVPGCFSILENTPFVCNVILAIC